MGYCCSRCGGLGGLFESSHLHSDPDSCFAELAEEKKRLLLQIQALQKNDYTGNYCNVCKTGIREKEARCEEGGKWFHPLCKVANERDAALLQNGELVEALKAGAKWMRWWLGNQECECENGHSCGRRERLLELEEMESILSKTEKRAEEPRKRIVHCGTKDCLGSARCDCSCSDCMAIKNF